MPSIMNDLVEEKDSKCCNSEKKSNVVITSVGTKLKQESTWRGLILVATLVGVKVSPDQVELVVSAAVSMVAAINIFIQK